MNRSRTSSSRPQGLIFVLSGPSGSGKTSLLKALLEAEGFKKKFVRSVSLTTRPRRSGERNKKDYFFISQGEFIRRRRQKKILEWTKYLGYYYATPRDVVDRLLGQGRNVMLCLDLKGARRVKELYPHRTVTIFIVPPSLTALRERITKRCYRTCSSEIQRRLALARKELASRRAYDYSLVNKDFNRALETLKKIVVREIRNRTNKE